MRLHWLRDWRQMSLLFHISNAAISNKIEFVIIICFHFSLQIMSNKDDGSPSNPMLYDPIPEGPGDTKKLMQFVAATIGM